MSSTWVSLPSTPSIRGSRAIDVGVDHAHLQTLGGQGSREVGGLDDLPTPPCPAPAYTRVREPALAKGDFTLGGARPEFGLENRRAARPT